MNLVMTNFGMDNEHEISRFVCHWFVMWRFEIQSLCRQRRGGIVDIRFVHTLGCFAIVGLLNTGCAKSSFQGEAASLESNISSSQVETPEVEPSSDEASVRCGANMGSLPGYEYFMSCATNGCDRQGASNFGTASLHCHYKIDGLGITSIQTSPNTSDAYPDYGFSCRAKGCDRQGGVNFLVPGTIDSVLHVFTRLVEPTSNERFFCSANGETTADFEYAFTCAPSGCDRRGVKATRSSDDLIHCFYR